MEQEEKAVFGMNKNKVWSKAGLKYPLVSADGSFGSRGATREEGKLWTRNGERSSWPGKGRGTEGGAQG